MKNIVLVHGGFVDGAGWEGVYRILKQDGYDVSIVQNPTISPKVAALVYIAAFAPDKGESVATLIKDPPLGAPVPPILPPQDGYLLLDKAKFPASFAGDVDPEKALFMADSQVPWGLEALNGKINEPAWKSKPSWYLITTHLINASTGLGCSRGRPFRGSSPSIARSGQLICGSSAAKQTASRSSNDGGIFASDVRLAFCFFDCVDAGRLVRSRNA